MGMTIEEAPADVAEAYRDSTRLNWLEAQAYIQMHEWVAAVPGGVSTFELHDLDGTVVGSGTTLRASIDDAMGNLMGGVAR
jgi:hypothetical protein